MYHKHQKIDEVRQVIELIRQMKQADPIDAERYLNFNLLSNKIEIRIKEINKLIEELEIKSGEGKEKYLNIWRRELANYKTYKSLIDSGVVRKDNYYLYEMNATWETPFGEKTKKVRPFVDYF